MAAKIDITQFEKETQASLHTVLHEINDEDVLKDLYAFFKDYRSHFYQRKGWYDARLTALQGLVTLVLTSVAAFLGLLIQQKEPKFDPLNIFFGLLFLTATVAVVITMLLIIVDLRPKADYRELSELDLINTARVKFKKNFYRNKITILALQSSSNGLRIEERYRLLQTLFRVFLASFLSLLVAGIILFARLDDKKQPDYTQTPAKIQVVDERSLQVQIDSMRAEIESLRAKVTPAPRRQPK